uniref:Uncharacterized protein n=1 Tax=Siphoviridae sp. ctHip2 TaxID=2827830 RepID=A0A8S5RVK0_9CAUD|nr:MAG TPA: hypothetical protein [Siphoviridae sp. ctHip2]
MQIALTVLAQRLTAAVKWRNVKKQYFTLFYQYFMALFEYFGAEIEYFTGDFEYF